jgi:hypothetical protein
MFFPTQITPAVSYTDPYLGIPLLMPGSKPINFLPGNEPGAINLFPDNIYGKRNYAITDPKTGIKFNISGPENKLIELLQQLTQIKQQQQQQQSGNTPGTLEELDTDIFGIDNTSNGISNLQQAQQTQQAQQAPPGTPGYSMIRNHRGEARLQLINAYGSKTIYYGGGVVLFMNHNGNPIVALFKSASDNIYQDLSGSVEYKDFNGYYTLKNTAIREAAEESANLIKINPNASIFAGNSNYVRMQFRNGIFRVYAISLGSNITPQDLAYNYGFNKNLLGNHGYKWNETNDVKFFNLGEITNKYAIGHSAPCPDINGNVYNVRRRTIKCIKQLVNQKGSPAQLAINSPSTVSRTTDASMNNTTSYVIS